ncbi:hypothetical protein [uncultured Alistipes sp.]|uniref:hypothetical protein n=1 Tax=uncultured Alistipes sp. TaxID=538949 RepID=UPI002601B5C1|nr:hypothetical protein [uncultured Alistipes sp.]
MRVGRRVRSIDAAVLRRRIRFIRSAASGRFMVPPALAAASVCAEFRATVVRRGVGRPGLDGMSGIRFMPARRKRIG